MKTLEKVGRFSICEDRGKLYLRWWDAFAKKTKSQQLASTKLPAARKESKELIRVIMDPSETILPTSGSDPTFGELWLNYEAEKRQKISKERMRLLGNRLDLYYRPNLWQVRMSRMGPALRALVKLLNDKGLHPNTSYDIISSAYEVHALAHQAGLTGIHPGLKPSVSGTTAPADRTPKGRYLEFSEIGALIDAARNQHVLDQLLFALGTGARPGAIGALKLSQIDQELGVINLLGEGEIESNKRRPIVPITGPMKQIIERRMLSPGSGFLIEWGGDRAVASRNNTQVIQRLVKRAGIRNDGKIKANWYSIRRTLADWLNGRVSDAAISSVLGHFEISARDRSRLFEEGSPTTDIYKRRMLEPIYQVAEVLEAEWWPEIQKHTSLELKQLKQPSRRGQENKGKDENKSHVHDVQITRESPNYRIG